MNYYEHHIGDYAEATGHLSLIQDAVYSRLLRKYYSTEKPLPADKNKLARWVGAVGNKEAMAALDVVLDDFFTLQDDGYHNERCDSEIEAFRDGEPERELRKVNEKNRLNNHRQERARLFKVLTDAGGHAAWNIGIAELRALVKSVAGDPKKAPVTKPATAPATPATATQTPIPITQYPINQGALVEHQQAGVRFGPDGPARAGFEENAGVGDIGLPNAVLAEQAAKAMVAAGLSDVSANHPRLRALLTFGLTVAELEDAARVAAAGGKGFPWALARAEGQRRDAAALGSLPSASPVVDPDSVAAIKADAIRLGVGEWSQIDDATGRTVPWAEYAAKVRAARVAERGEVAA